MAMIDLLCGLVRRVCHALGVGGGLVVLVVMVWLLGMAVHELMKATDYFGTDPFRDHLYLDGAAGSVQDLSDFPPDQRRVTNSLGMELVLIPAGRFVMGSPRSEGALDFDELPHRVRITKPFYLGVHEVSVAQFRRFVEQTGYRTDAEIDPIRTIIIAPGSLGTTANACERCSWRTPGVKQADDHPVAMVTWQDAMAFCLWLSGREGGAYRLPTEAEWEYACRAGTATRYWRGGEDRTLCRSANVLWTNDCDSASISWKDGYPFTSPSGTLVSNPFGLFDMHGNVWEWCSDWYDQEYYRESPRKDPQGPSSGCLRVLRGGSFLCLPYRARSANRYPFSPNCTSCDIGFRVAMSYGRP
jgi:formylglycine-generating enzyme required for sulfatase activity